MSALSLVCSTIRNAAGVAGQHLIVEPARGIVEIVRGVAMTGPELVRAACEAAVEAVKSRLSGTARANVRQGTEKVLAGAKLLVAPAAVAVAIIFAWHPKVLCLAWLLVLTTGLAVG